MTVFVVQETIGSIVRHFGTFSSILNARKAIHKHIKNYYHSDKDDDAYKIVAYDAQDMPHVFNIYYDVIDDGVWDD